MDNDLANIKNFISNNSTALDRRIEVYTILFLDSTPVNWHELLQGLSLEQLTLNDLDPENWLSIIQEKLSQNNVALLITQKALEIEWGNIINWKNHLNQIITNDDGNTAFAKKGSLFLIMSIEDPDSFNISDVKKLSEAVYNYNVEY